MITRASFRQWAAALTALAVAVSPTLSFAAVAAPADGVMTAAVEATPLSAAETASALETTPAAETTPASGSDEVTLSVDPTPTVPSSSTEDTPGALADIAPPSVGIVRLEEIDERLSVVGSWVRAGSTAFSSDAYMYAYAAGSSVSGRFTGTAITILGAKGPSYGKIEVFVDGVSRGIVDCYNAAYALAAPVFTLSGLADAQHRVTVRVLGIRNAASSSAVIVIDAIDVTGEALDATVADPEILVGGAEDNDSRLVWQGLWTSGSSTAASGGTYRYASIIGSYVDMMFTGSSVAWIGTMSPGSGTAEVFLDGVSLGIVDAYSPTTRYGQVVWFADNLADGRHRVTIKATGQRNTLATGSRITIDRLAAPGVRIPCYEEGDSRVNIVGAWTSVTSSEAESGKYLWSATVESHVVIRFNGTSMRWCGPVGPEYGKAEVYLDGRLVGTVDQYAETASAHQIVWSVSGLKDGQHAVVIRVLGEKSAASTGTRVAFDCAESVRGTYGTAENWAVAAIGVDDYDARLVRTGFWVRARSVTFSGDGYSYSASPGAKLSATFTGASVSVCGSRGPSYGKAQVFVDGTSRGVVDCYAADYAHGVPLWAASDLASGNHTVVLKVLGTRSEASTGSVVVIDGLEASGGRFLTACDERSAQVGRSSGWMLASSAAMLDGTYAYSRTAGATMTLTAIGSSVALIASTGPSYGKVQVYIDGTSYGVIDLYSAGYAHQATVFERAGLTDGRHTVVVKVLGTRNAASSASTVVLDGFAVTGERVTVRSTIVATLRAQLGKQYVWAGAGPNVFDCSGVTLYAYRSAGISLPHSSRIMWSMCSPQYLDWDELAPGDLVFTDDPNYIHHVGVYVGYGLTINAPGTGKFVEYRAADTYGCYGKLAAKYW